MNFVVDSGSTQSTWCCVERGMKISIAGLNPLTTSEKMRDAILGIVHPRLLQEGPVDGIHFYGAGCGSEEGKRIITESLQKEFGEITVTVDTDLMGACRGLLGHSKGYVGILGTGSNACYFDGNIIARKVCSMGYLLGDEGSGNHIGRLLVKGFLSNRMPKEIAECFESNYCDGMTKEAFVKELYSDDQVNATFGQMTYFANYLRNSLYMEELLIKAFRGFATEQLLPIMNDNSPKEISLSGSVAWIFKPFVIDALSTFGITVLDTVISPIDNLAVYHKNS